MWSRTATSPLPRGQTSGVRGNVESSLEPGNVKTWKGERAATKLVHCNLGETLRITLLKVIK